MTAAAATTHRTPHTPYTPRSYVLRVPEVVDERKPREEQVVTQAAQQRAEDEFDVGRLAAAAAAVLVAAVVAVA
jgi:hypothetical protein